jgi:hypothetical protein
MQEVVDLVAVFGEDPIQQTIETMFSHVQDRLREVIPDETPEEYSNFVEQFNRLPSKDRVRIVCDNKIIADVQLLYVDEPEPGYASRHRIYEITMTDRTRYMLIYTRSTDCTYEESRHAIAILNYRHFSGQKMNDLKNSPWKQHWIMLPCKSA